jgi:Lectin C-type domain
VLENLTPSVPSSYSGRHSSVQVLYPPQRERQKRGTLTSEVDVCARLDFSSRLGANVERQTDPASRIVPVKSLLTTCRYAPVQSPARVLPSAVASPPAMKIAGYLLRFASTWTFAYGVLLAWRSPGVAEDRPPVVGAAAAASSERSGRDEPHPFNYQDRDAAEALFLGSDNAHDPRNLKGTTKACLPEPKKKPKGMMMRCAPSPTRAPRVPTSLPSSRPSSAPSEDICATLKENPENGHRYGVLSYVRAIDWLAANDTVRGLKRCCDKPAHLASITSQSENDFLRTVLPDDGYIHEAWIGINNRTGGFRWEGTDEAPGFEFWCTQERGCGDDDPEVVCASLESLYGLWIERYCNGRNYDLLVEYDCAGS